MNSSMVYENWGAGKPGGSDDDPGSCKSCHEVEHRRECNGHTTLGQRATRTLNVG